MQYINCVMSIRTCTMHQGEEKKTALNMLTIHAAPSCINKLEPLLKFGAAGEAGINTV
jgi:hypothetical protein